MPAIVQKYCVQNTPYEGTVQCMRSTAAISGGGANSSKASSMSKHILSAPTDFAVDVVNKGDMPSNAKNTSSKEQNKIPLIRFKIPTDSVRHSNSSAIYSGLGLDDSPSSSFEDSSVESPIHMIQIMTSYQIPGGSLHSPLREDLLKLPERYNKAFARDAKNRTVKVKLQKTHAPKRNEFESRMDFQCSKERKERLNEKHGKHTEVKKENDEIRKNATNSTKKDPGLLPVAAVINENWVQCDACEKWRLLPLGVDTTYFPQKWLCRMLDWLPSMNHCEVSEDETTQAVRAFYAQPQAQCQLNASRGQFQPRGVIASAAVVDSTQAEPSHDMKAFKSSNIFSNGKIGQVRVKRKSEGEADVHKHLKKIKAKATTGITEDIVEKICSKNITDTQVKISDAKLKKYNDSLSPKKMRGVSAMDKTFRDQVQMSLETDSRRTYSVFETGNVFRRDTLAKNKKIFSDGEEDTQSDSPAPVKKIKHSFVGRIEHSHEGLYIHGKNRRSHEGPLEIRAHSPYNEPSRRGKEFIDAKRSIISEKNIRNDIDWSRKTDSRKNKFSEARGGNQLKNSLDDDKEVMPSDLHAKKKGTWAGVAATNVSLGEFSEVPKESRKADNLNVALNCRLKPPTSNGVSGRDSEINSCMKEAKDLKHVADNLKSKGMDLESNSLYFNAALKFLKTASLMELCNGENARDGEITRSMTLYTDTAKLCKYCAHRYERNKEMAAAALAYKCMAVAHMRVVHSKSIFISRDQHELQMAFQNAPSGDSPSSSALMDENSAHPGKVAGSPQEPSDHVIAARHLALYARVLQYTRDSIAAVEAFEKSENAFSVANGSLDDASHEIAGISAVKRVMDFHFNDIDTLLHLVKLAIDAMSHEFGVCNIVSCE